MGARVVHKRHNHRSAATGFDYQIRDHRGLGFGDTVVIVRGDGTIVGRVGKKQFVDFAKGMGLRGEKLRRQHRRASEGQLLSLTVPADIVGAMKLGGLLKTPKEAFLLLAPALKAAMAKVNEYGYGRTTGGALVKGDIHYAVFVGHTNRMGELALQLSVWLFPTVRAANGKHLALHVPPIVQAQQKIKSVWHMGIADTLWRKHGILCGPKGHSFFACGAKTTTKRSAQMKKASRRFRYAGHASRQRTARLTRKKKKVVSWGDAVRSLKAAARGTLTRTVKTLSEERVKRLARRCVKLGFRYCNENAKRYTSADAYSTGAHLSLPKVQPEVFDREFKLLTEKPELLGASVVKTYRDGNVLYTSVAEMRAEEKAGAALWALSRKTAGGFTRKDVAKALAGQGLDRTALAALQQVVGKQQAVVDPAVIQDIDTLRRAADLYLKKGRQVFAVGEAAAKALDLPVMTAHGLAESLTRTSIMQSLWRGMRTPGPLAHKLWAARKIRKHAHTRLQKGSLIVVSTDDTQDAKAVTRLAEGARKAGAKLVVTGPGAKAYTELVAEHAQKTTAQALSHQLKGAHL